MGGTAECKPSSLSGTEVFCFHTFSQAQAHRLVAESGWGEVHGVVTVTTFVHLKDCRHEGTVAEWSKASWRRQQPAGWTRALRLSCC
jgi:hypothetical protein